MTRFYLPGIDSPDAPVSPTVGTVWDLSAGLIRLTLVETPTDFGNDNETRTETSPGPVTYCVLQYVSDPDLFAVGPVSGQFSYAGKFAQGTGAQAGAYMRIAVVSGDGTTERGELYVGPPTAGGPNLAGSVCIWDHVAFTEGTTFQSGDRIVVELGVKFNNTTTSSKRGIVQVGDPTAGGGDYPLVAGTSSGNRCWIEFDTVDTVQPPTGLAETHDCTTATLTWDAAPGDIDGYQVRIDGGTPTDVGDTLSNLFTDLAPNTEYLLEVRAYGPGGESGWVGISSTTTCTTPAGDCEDGDCSDPWLIESCDIKTGLVLNVLDPLGFDFQISKNAVGQGSMTFPTQGVRVQDIWPYLSLIAIAKPTDDPDNPEGLFLGIVDSFGAQSSEDGGTTSVGLLEITHYLWRRLIRDNYEAIDTAQTLIARDLVGLTSGEIPLSAVASPSSIRRTFQWLASERPVIGDEVAKLTTMIDGPDWETTYTRTNGAWSATMRFADEVGVFREIVLSSDREGASYSLSVDGSQQATLIDGFAPSPEGEETEVVIVTEQDTTGPYPLLETAISYSDLPLADGEDPAATTRPFVQGDLANRKEPAAVPEMTIAGNVPPPSELKVGDEVTVHIDHGAITYHGQARVIDISWRVQSEAPDLRTLGFEPISRPSESVLNQVPSDDCEDC